jgi:hypothetical protein
MADDTRPVHLSLLRALLTGDHQTYDRLEARLTEHGAWEGFENLISASFCLALTRRYGKGHPAANVIRLVAQVRMLLEETGEDIDPREAEHLIRAALGDGNVVIDISERTAARVMPAVLIFLIHDEQLDDGQIDDFIHQADLTLE